MSIANNIKHLRESHGMSQAEFGGIAGVTDKAVSTWETGRKEPRMGAIQKIADYFGIKKSDIIEEPESTASKAPIGFEPIPSYHMIPVIGDIACGVPILAEENIDGYEPCPDFVHADFSLHCHGDSMIGAEIHDGDIVFIHKQPEVQNGQIAAVQIDNDGCYNATLKRFYRSGNTVTLMAENPSVNPMVFVRDEINRIHIAGLAVYCLSKIK
jgi:repressor LexA